MSSKIENSQFMQIFSTLPDPRKARNQLYSISDLISTAILAVLCGYEDWEDVSMWTEGQLHWLQPFGLCLNGAPSHDTYSRFFRFLDPDAMEKCFIEWVHSLLGKITGVIAIDGKTLRGSLDGDIDAIHMVSAFATGNEMILGQLKTAGKGKELEGIKLMIKLLDLEGVTVTIDAGGCHKEIAKMIQEQRGDYILGLKGNQWTLKAEAENFFGQVMEASPEEWEEQCGCHFFVSEEKSRNRQEKREIWATDNLEWLPQKNEWKGLKSLICLRSTRAVDNKITEELRFYISSRAANAEALGKDIRLHWGIENKVHYVLDVSYGEDACRVRKDHGAENLSILRRAVQNMAKREQTKKLSGKKKRTLAAMNAEYRIKLLGAMVGA